MEQAMGLATSVHTRNRDPRWLEFVARSQPSLFQSPDWASLMEETYGFPARVAMVLENGAVVGGLPYSEIEDFRGRRRVAGAFADVCEPLGDPRIWSIVERAMCEEGVPWQIRSRAKPSELASEIREVGVLQTVELQRSADEAFLKCDSKKRNKLRLGARAALMSRSMYGESSIDAFYRLHSLTRKEKHRLLPQPKKLFEEIAQRFLPDRGFVLAIEREKSVIATALLIAYGDTLYVKFAASNRADLMHRPNDFLFWKIIEYAIGADFRAVDMGLSETEDLARFKRGYGAESTPAYVGKYGIDKLKTPPARMVEEALQKVTAAMTEPDVPLAVAQAGGDALYRFFV